MMCMRANISVCGIHSINTCIYNRYIYICQYISGMSYSLSIRSHVCVSIVLILQYYILLFACNVRQGAHGCPTVFCRACVQTPQRSRGNSAELGFQTMPGVHYRCLFGHRRAEQRIKVMAGMAGKVNRNGIKKGPKKIHMKRNLQDTSSTFTKGSCLQALLYEEQIVLRPSVSQEASQNFEVHVPWCFPSWQASWICRKI